MSESITTKEFADGIRTIGVKFSINGIVTTKMGAEFAGSGTVTRTRDSFVLHITFPVGGEPPKSETGTFTSEDCWSFEGTIGINLNLSVQHLAPWGTTHWNNGVTSRVFETHTLSLPASGFDAFPTRPLSAKVDPIQTPEGKTDGEPPSDINTEILPPSPIKEALEEEKPSPYSNGVWIHAYIPDFPLIHTNGGTVFVEKNDFLGVSTRGTTDTFSGSFDQFKIGLVRRDDDLNVYLYLPHTTDETISAQTHEQFLTAFLTGLAFATGQHCWPFQVTIRQNGTLLVDKLHAVRKLDRSSLAPFSERIGFNAAVGQIEWQFADFLGKATSFFNSKTELSKAASRALWLLRSADAKNVPSEITLMSLCVLLESLTGLIFDANQLSSTQDATSFEETRTELLKWIEEKNPRDGSGLQRFQNIITSARLERAKDKYKAVSEHFGLQWDGLMKDAWAIWEKVRNNGAHDILRKEKEQKIDTHFTATGRIAGAINVLVLRLIGYTGIARTSVFENKHHKI
jgi:hypothetical protein